MSATKRTVNNGSMAALLVLATSTLLGAVTAEEWRAVVVLQGGGTGVSGNLTLRQTDPAGPVVISGAVKGLAPGLHGFHIHEKGDLSGGCMSTGGHFNPYQLAHGAPDAAARHVGDLGNIFADARGVATVDVSDSLISLCGGPTGVVGRGVVVHAGVDDLGVGGQTDSLTTGHAGARLACGVIGITLEPSSFGPTSLCKSVGVVPRAGGDVPYYEQAPPASLPQHHPGYLHSQEQQQQQQHFYYKK